jgi:transposase
MHGGNANNDRLDSHTIAALRRGGLMPQADVSPRRLRATRDLLRRRKHLLHQRAEWYAPIQHTASESNLSAPLGRIAKPQNRRGLLARFDHGCVQQNMAVDTALLDGYDPLLAALEHSIETTAHRHDPVSLARLRTIPGVGNILALVLRDEIEEIARFPRVQACVASGRMVKSAREAHGTRDGPSGQKIGNAHLTWAFSEAAVLFLKPHEPAQQYLTKRAHSRGQGKGLSILAHKRGRALYGMLNKPVAFDQEKCMATEGWRERTSLASHGSHRGQRPHPLRIAPSDQARRTCARTSGACAERQSRHPVAWIGGPFRAAIVPPRAHTPG